MLILGGRGHPFRDTSAGEVDVQTVDVGTAEERRAWSGRFCWGKGREEEEQQGAAGSAGDRVLRSLVTEGEEVRPDGQTDRTGMMGRQIGQVDGGNSVTAHDWGGRGGTAWLRWKAKRRSLCQMTANVSEARGKWTGKGNKSPAAGRANNYRHVGRGR